jgi:LuxR family maltose regulon positive regulatory protein
VSTQPSNQVCPAQSLLDHGNQYKVVLLVAPSGAGKQRLIQRWLEQSAVSPVWISVDHQDTNLQDFLGMFFVELTRWDQNFAGLVEGRAGSSADQNGYHPTDPGTMQGMQPGLENLLIQTLNCLMELPDDRHIIIHNYHNLRDPGIHPVISYLIDYLPPNIHLIISSQELPALQIPRLRARRELLEIGPGDLDCAGK